MTDRRTLNVYAERAGDYAACFDAERPGTHLTRFIDALPTGARVLDLGCGTGRAAVFMREAGLDVTLWDASSEMARLAKEMHGLDVTVASFDELAVAEEFDGIFASFSLLHAPKKDMPGHLARIAKALRSDGLFYLGLKSGSGEARDRLGRFYAYYGEDEIAGLLEAVGLTIMTRDTGEEQGLDGTVAPWIILTARKTG